ncbi:MAG TPA: cell division protein FtsL [Polyangiales bacterium]
MKKMLKMRTLTWWLTAVLTTGVAYVSYLALRFETIRLGYEVNRARGEHERLVATHRLIALEVQSLRERERVNTIASRSLGMGAPDVARVVTVEAGGFGARERGMQGAGTSRALGARRAR